MPGVPGVPPLRLPPRPPAGQWHRVALTPIILNRVRGRGLRGLRGPRCGIDVSEWAVIYSARRAAAPPDPWKVGGAAALVGSVGFGSSLFLKEILLWKMNEKEQTSPSNIPNLFKKIK